MTTVNPQQATITATGEATVPVPCDVAWLHLVLVEDAKIVGEALEHSGARVSLVLDRIRETEPRLPETVTEVERKIEPLFDTDGSLDGFRVHRVVRAQMPPEPAGLLLDVAIMAGAGPGSRIAFGVRDPAAARASAIDAALRAAQTNAAAAATSLGCELGELRETTVESVVPDEFSDPLVLVSGHARLVYSRSC
ncbi:MAG: SIMPL domain-containing protein [Nannocystaceae bacterium]|nr:SIMPL domain-containing protein [Nannocystaceae bacterium]